MGMRVFAIRISQRARRLLEVCPRAPESACATRDATSAVAPHPRNPYASEGYVAHLLPAPTRWLR